MRVLHCPELVDCSTDVRAALRDRDRMRRAELQSGIQQMMMAGKGGDPFYNNVGFLLHFDGTNGATTTVDSGPRNKTVTRTTAGSIDTSQSVFGGSSWLTGGGTNGYLSMAQDTTFITASGATPWTWEARIRPSAFTTDRALFDCDNTSSNTTGWQIYVNTAGKFGIYSGTQSTSYGLLGSAMSTGTWYALRICWDGTTLYFFQDGVLLGTATGFANTWGTGVFIANSAFVNQAFLGNIDEMRWTKGVARSTATYALDTSAFPNY